MLKKNSRRRLSLNAIRKGLKDLPPPEAVPPLTPEEIQAIDDHLMEITNGDVVGYVIKQVEEKRRNNDAKAAE